VPRVIRPPTVVAAVVAGRMFPDEALRASDVQGGGQKQIFYSFLLRYSCVPHSSLGGAGVHSMGRQPFHCNFFIILTFF
jgi:hypothetical protein